MQRRLSAWILLLFSCAVFAHSSQAQDQISLVDPNTTYRLDSNTGVFIDSTNSLSFTSIVEKPDAFKYPGRNLTFGYLPSTIWLKVDLYSKSQEHQWLLEIPAPFLEYVDFYQFMPDGTFEKSEAGYYRKQSARKVSHTTHILPLVFGQNGATTVFIKISGRSPKTFPLFAIEREHFNSKVRYEDIGYGIFFGILFVMFFFNLFIYFSLRQTNYLLYICTIVCTFLIFGAASGYAGKFLWPEHPMLNYYAGRLTLPVLTIFLSIFTIRFMEVQQYSRFLYYVLASFIPLAVIAFILVVTETMSSAGNNLISLSTIFYIATGIVCSARGNKTAKYFIAAWTTYIVGGLLLTTRNSGLFDFNFWTTHLVEIGAALETMIIGFALGDRYRRYKQEKEEIQLLAFKAQQEATERLEVKVKERTEQLSRANEELNSTLETNKMQTRIIEEKNAELDAFFYRISHDLRGPVNTLLGFSELAQRDVSDPKAREYFRHQHNQVERVNNIINGLIELTKLNDGQLKKEKIDLRRLVDDCLSSFNGYPKFDKINVSVDIQPGLEFYSEWTLLNAIVQNLIENAIKYSTDNDPFIRIEIRLKNEDLSIKVQDNGQGIPPDQHAKIFDMFYRATQTSQGSGLGLYILKRSLQRLNGSITVESDISKGSIFTVMVPNYQLVNR